MSEQYLFNEPMHRNDDCSVRQPNLDTALQDLCAESRTLSSFAVTEPRLDLSIVVCTHNRIALLSDLLASLGPQLEDVPVELIVVDSASAPDQAAAARTLVESTARSRLIRLDDPGVSLARNAGLSAARAPWVAYLDDDEIPAPDWVEQARMLAHRLPDNCAACGGNTIPVFPDGTTRVLSPRWLAFLSSIERDCEFDQTAAPQLPIGHSLVRAAAVRDAGGFDPRLGRIEGSLLSGEEVLLTNRLVSRRWRIWHSNRIVVGHRISADRLTRSWVRDRAFWEGVTTFRVILYQEQRGLWQRLLETAMKRPLLWIMSIFAAEHRDIDLRLGFIQGFHHAMIEHSRAVWHERKLWRLAVAGSPVLNATDPKEYELNRRAPVRSTSVRRSSTSSG